MITWYIDELSRRDAPSKGSVTRRPETYDIVVELAQRGSKCSISLQNDYEAPRVAHAEHGRPLQTAYSAKSRTEGLGGNIPGGDRKAPDRQFGCVVIKADDYRKVKPGAAGLVPMVGNIS